jgi:hypothetical protein
VSVPPSTPETLASEFSAVAKSSPSCHDCSLTETAFPPPGRSAPRVGVDFRRPCGTTRSSDFCWVIGFRSLVLRPTTCVEPSRSHWVRPTDITTIPSPLRPQLRRISGFVAACRLTRCRRLTALRFRSKRSCTYGFHQTPPRGNLAHAATRSFRCSGTAPLPPRCRVPSVRAPDQAPEQRPCHLGVGFPPSGPRIRICVYIRSPPVCWSCQSHRDLRSNHLTSTPPPPNCGSPRGDDTLRSPIHASTVGRKTRREPRTRLTRFSTLHTPRPESGRGRSELVRTEARATGMTNRPEVSVCRRRS